MSSANIRSRDGSLALMNGASAPLGGSIKVLGLKIEFVHSASISINPKIEMQKPWFY
jgi:hypothetical protein